MVLESEGRRMLISRLTWKKKEVIREKKDETDRPTDRHEGS